MYLGIDVGGTKVLVAVLSDKGEIVEKDRFPTPEKYSDFLQHLEATIARFEHQDFKAGGMGTAGKIDRKNGRLVSWSNNSWYDLPLQEDLERTVKCPIALENDAKMGGLSEAMLLKNQFNKVLYIAIGTGIGVALIADQHIDASVGDGGGRALMLEHKGHLTSWEDFAGGKAFVERFGKKAQEVTDEKTWKDYSRSLSQGLLQLIAVTEPAVIVVGGSVGVYFDRFSGFLTEELNKYALPQIKMPELREAQRPEEAVVYGCYDLAKQLYG